MPAGNRGLPPSGTKPSAVSVPSSLLLQCDIQCQLRRVCFEEVIELLLDGRLHHSGKGMHAVRWSRNHEQ